MYGEGKDNNFDEVIIIIYLLCIGGFLNEKYKPIINYSELPSIENVLWTYVLELLTMITSLSAKEFIRYWRPTLDSLKALGTFVMFLAVFVFF